MRIIDNLKVLFTPSVWIIPFFKYSKEWDTEMRQLLIRYRFTLPTFYETTKLGHFEVRNNYFSSVDLNVRPSRKTILIARKKYEQDIIKQIRKTTE